MKVILSGRGTSYEELVDSRNSSSQVDSDSYNQSDGDGNEYRTIVNIINIDDNTDWSGKIFLLTTGNAATYGEIIQSQSPSPPSYASQVVLYGLLPYIPAEGDEYIVFGFSDPVITPEKYFGREIRHVVFETSIKGGFKSAEIHINCDVGDSIIYINRYVGHHIEIFDDDMEHCWEGWISEIRMDTNGVIFACLGYYQTLNYQQFSLVYSVDDDPTTVEVVEDILEDSKWIANDRHRIDPDDTIQTNQSSSDGGIGTHDFGTQPTKAIDALDVVLKYGDYSSDHNPLCFLVYRGRTPELKVIPRDVTHERVDWYIDERNISGSGDFTKTLANMANRLSIQYTTEEGDVAQTSWVHNLASLKKYGEFEVMESLADIRPEEYPLILPKMINEGGDSTVANSIAVSGMIQSGEGGQLRYSCSRIKSGDVISLDPLFARYGIYPNDDLDHARFRVTGTSYDSSSDITTIDVGMTQEFIQAFGAYLSSVYA